MGQSWGGGRIRRRSPLGRGMGPATGCGNGPGGLQQWQQGHLQGSRGCPPGGAHPAAGRGVRPHKAPRQPSGEGGEGMEGGGLRTGAPESSPKPREGPALVPPGGSRTDTRTDTRTGDTAPGGDPFPNRGAIASPPVEQHLRYVHPLLHEPDYLVVLQGWPGNGRRNGKRGEILKFKAKNKGKKRKAWEGRPQRW